MKKPGIYFKDGKIHCETTKDKLILVIVFTPFSSIILYIILVAIANQPVVRPSQAAISGILNVIPPIIWAGISFLLGLYEVFRLSILLYREKEENAKKAE